MSASKALTANGRAKENAPTYTLPDGEVVELQPIPPLIINTIQSDTRDRPTPPITERKVGRQGKVITEPNYDHPGYKAALENYNARQYERLLQAAVALGIVTEPPKAKTVDRVAVMMFGHDYTDDQRKYAWIASKVQSEQDSLELLNAILDLTVITEEGIAQSEAVFPDNA